MLIDAVAPHFDEAAYRATIGVARFRRDASAAVRVLPIHAGAAPMHLFSEEIGIPYAFGGLGRGGGAHGPDEYILTDDLAPFMRSVASFLFRFAEYTEDARCRPT